MTKPKYCRFINQITKDTCDNIGKERKKETFVDYDYLCDKHYYYCNRLVKNQRVIQNIRRLEL